VAKKRLDILLVERGLLPSREKARRAIRAGLVAVDGHPSDKPGRAVESGAGIELLSPPRYVGRGGEKLKGALEDFGLSPAGRVALDLGSSTGGFTDCLLQEGARRVYCLDVGRGQLAWKLRRDPRVVVKEGFNARYLTPGDLPEEPDLITIDLAFISLKKVLSPAAGVLAAPGEILALVKPQFEARRPEIGRGGVVRDPEVRRRVTGEIAEYGRSLGLTVRGVRESRLPGPAGNREFFLLLSRDA